MQEKKWCLILGVSSGMGRAAAVSLAAEGYHILGVYFDLAEKDLESEALAEGLRAGGSEVHFWNRNADSKKTRDELVAAMAVLLGGSTIDLMLHSLAFGTLLPFIKSGEGNDVIQKSQMEMTLSVMAHSLVYWTQDLWEKRLLGRGSQIFAMTSGGSVMYTRNYGAVSAAKCALESHVRQLATELAPHGVMVNCLRAGVTDTPSLRKIPEYQALMKRAAENNPHGRLSTPEDIGFALRGLARIRESWLTGNVINVDGGEILTI